MPGAQPLTVLTPVPRWWSVWVRGTWLVAARTARVAKPLRDLSFIHFAHWSLVSRWPPDRRVPRDRQAAPRALLFLTTFDGSMLQYVDAFSRVVPGRIRGLYWGAEGFPGPRHAVLVAQYIHDHEQEIGHAWAAHPDATVTMVDQALELSERHREFAARARALDPPRFAAAWRRFLADAQGLL